MTTFRSLARGASAGLNSVTFYACEDCGACIADKDFERSDKERERCRSAHAEWHARLDRRVAALYAGARLNPS
jgi:hypothetical protein